MATDVTKSRGTRSNRLTSLIPAALFLAGLAIHRLLPNQEPLSKAPAFTFVLAGAAVLLLVIIFLSLPLKKLGQAYSYRARFISAVAVFLILWDLVTQKFALLPLPYFPGPDKVFLVFVSDWKMLLKSTLYSARLLLLGYAIGGGLGLVSGIFMGWSKRVNYWLGPILKIIGPIPATAWIPIALVAFPTSFTASIFLIALAVWFPVAVMTSSGISNVQNAYFEVARTLGGGPRYLVLRVAVPAAAPSIFIGLFMGLGTSFLTLIAAEMLGVKAGLGWYINWAQGWAEFYKVYACLIVLALLFSGIIKLLFIVKDQLLSWQKGLIKW